MVRGQGFCAAGVSQGIVLGCSVIVIQSASQQMHPVSGSAFSAWDKVNNIRTLMFVFYKVALIHGIWIPKGRTDNKHINAK